MKPQSRRLAACAAVLLECAWAASTAAQSPQTEVARTCDEGELRTHLAADPRRVAMAGGRVSLVPPEGMRALTPDEIRQRREQGELLLVGREGTLILGDDAGRTISLEVMGFTDRQEVEAFLDVFDWTLAAFGVTRWISRRQGEGVRMHGTRWLRLEYFHRFRGREHEHYVQRYMTDFQGQVLMATFSTPSPRGRSRDEFANIAATLRVSDCALPRENTGPPPDR
jgi:hypothetical protein